MVAGDASDTTRTYGNCVQETWPGEACLLAGATLAPHAAVSLSNWLMSSQQNRSAKRPNEATDEQIRAVTCIHKHTLSSSVHVPRRTSIVLIFEVLLGMK